MLQKPINQPSQQPKIIEDDAKKRQRGTGFTNISKVLGANVGAGQKMGQAIGGQLGQQAEQIRKGIEQGQSQFQAGLQKEKQEQAQTIGRATSAIGDIQNELKKGDDFYKREDQLLMPPNLEYADIGSKLKTAAYGGPKQIENIVEQQQRAANVAALGRLSGISGGQQELLRSQIAGRGRYGLGQSALDALLLGKEGQRELQQARSKTGMTESAAEQAKALSEAQALSAESEIEASKLATQRKLREEAENVLRTGTEQAQQYYKTGKFAQDALQKLISSPDPKSVQLTEEEKDALTKAQDLGIDVNTAIDTRNPALVNDMVNRISKAGSSVYSGGQIFTPTQKAMMENLDLLQQGKRVDRKEAERDLFGDVSKETSKLLADEYADRLKRENLYAQARLPETFNRDVFKKSAQEAGFDVARMEEMEKWQSKYAVPLQQQLLNALFMSEDRNRGYAYGGGQAFGPDERNWALGDKYIDYLKSKEREYQAQNNATVQDYIDNILGTARRFDPGPRKKLTQI